MITIEKDWLEHMPSFLFFFLPLFGLLATIGLNNSIFKRVKGFHGVGSVINALSRKSAFIKPMLMYAQMITSSICVGFGGSCGLESPIVVTGSAIGSNTSRFFRLSYKHRALFVGCGAAAGIAAIFNAPVAGLIFAIEVILPQLATSTFIPLLISAASGTLLSQFYFGSDILFHVAITSEITHAQIPQILLLGVVGGLFSAYYIGVSNRFKQWAERIKNPITKGVIGGLSLGSLIYLFPALYGEGYVGIDSILNDTNYSLYNAILPGTDKSSWFGPILIFLFLSFLKPIAANITILSGGEGGQFAPSFVTGGFVGYLFAIVNNELLGFQHVDPVVFTLLGMASVLGGVMHAPLTALFLIAELTTSYVLFVPLMIVIAISYFVKMSFNRQAIHFQDQTATADPNAFHQELYSLNFIDLRKLIERDFTALYPDQKLIDLINAITGCKRNVFPVLNEEHELLGIVLLDDIRGIMFNTELHDSLKVSEVMVPAPAIIQVNEPMESVIKKFEASDAWYLPVMRGTIYKGFLTKTKLLQAYKEELKRNKSML